MSEHQATFIRPRWRTGNQLFEIEREGDSVGFNEVMTFDLTSEEVHETSATATDHPVGHDNISDHVINEPRRLSIDVEMTATPLVQEGERNRLEETHDALVELLQEGMPLRVVTTLEDYGDLILERYQTRVTPDTGERLVASLEFKQVTIVTPEIVDVDPSVIQEQFRASAKASEDTGKQTPDEPSEEEEGRGQSILAGIAGIE